MSINYTQQKLWQAMDCLIGAEGLNERLRKAAVLLTLLPSPAFPAMPALEAQLQDVVRRLEPTSDGISDEDGEKLALDILSLFAEATRAAQNPVNASETVISPSDVH